MTSHRLECDPRDCAPKFSIIIATYNRAHLIGRAINSALAQTFRDFEVVIVDDGSVDSTPEVLEKFNDHRIRLFSLETNRGVSRAKNVGLRQAKGEYLVILDSDDELLPEFLSEIDRLTSLARGRTGVYFTNRIRVRDTSDGQQLIGKDKMSIMGNADPYLYFLRERPGGTGFGTTFSRAALEEVGLFDEDLGSAIDKDLLLRVFRSGFASAQSALYLHKIHIHEGPRVTKNAQTKAQSYERIYAKHGQALDRYPAIAAQAYNHLATLHHLAGNLRKQVHWIRQAVRKKPLRLRLLVKWVIFETQRGLAHLYR